MNIYEVSEAAEGKQTMKLLGHSNKITALQFSAKGNLASADEGKLIMENRMNNKYFIKTFQVMLLLPSLNHSFHLKETIESKSNHITPIGTSPCRLT